MPFGFDEADPRCIEFKARLKDTIETLIGEGYAHLISAGAQGMDMFAAEAVLELKEKYPWITLEMVSPFDAQVDHWNDEYRMRHDRLFATADIVTATGHEYTKAYMFRWPSPAQTCPEQPCSFYSSCSGHRYSNYVVQCGHSP